ncbi:unnamed protein product [Porites lobata]|uniref:Uncharacterized protein n=1 Tax=Porites lobata TaxID=104759 RepID=A0ABN8NIZ1_9CNID|nr:unnamed protein product [Porites lobata]
MPRKRKHSSEEEDEEAEDVENNVRTKRRAAVEARDRVAAKEGASDDEEEEEDFEEEDDDKDEDYEGEAPDEDEGEEEADDDDDEEEENEAGERDERDEEDEEVDEEEPETVLCILADLEEPTEDTPGYVLKKKDSPKKLELCFMGDMRETLVDVSEAFSKHFDEEKLPVLHITKFDMIGETEGTTQIDVLEVKYDKSYDARQLDEPSEDILSQDFYSVVRVDGIDGTWASQYFLPED